MTDAATAVKQIALSDPTGFPERTLVQSVIEPSQADPARQRERLLRAAIPAQIHQPHGLRPRDPFLPQVSQ